MNPFAEDIQFDPRLYEVVSRAGKKNDKTKLKGLRELNDMLDGVDLEANIDTLLEVVEDAMKSQDLQIKNLSIDILYRLLSSVKDRLKFKRVLSIWLYGFIENPVYSTSKKIFTEFVRIEELEDEFVQILNFKENPVLGLSCLQLLVKKGRKDYSGVISENIKYLDLNSARELREIYKLCKMQGKIEGLYKKVVEVRGPNLANLKWKILLDIFGSVPECIKSDGKYLDSETLSRAVEKLDVCDDIPVRTIDALRIVFPKIKDKRHYMKGYLKNGSIEEICILEFLNDFHFLNENAGFETVNKLIENVMNIHFQSDRDVEKSISKMNIEVHSESCPSPNEKLRESHEHICSLDESDFRGSILRMLLSSLDGLHGKKKIIRADILGIELNPDEFSKEEIEEVFQHSVNVFPKDYILNSSFSCNLLPLVLKYPEDVGEEKIRKTICKDNLFLFIPVCKDLDFLRSLVFSYDNRSINEIYLSSDIPSELDLDFYYRLGDKIDKPRIVDYKRVLEQYLDREFISGMIESEIMDRNVLYTTVVEQLSLTDVPISTSYTSAFYDWDECFYRDIKIREQSQMVLGLRDVYICIHKGALEAFLLLVLDAMCDDEDESLDEKLKSMGVPGGKKALAESVLGSQSAIEKWKNTDLGTNQHFVEKVFFDLGLPSRRCGDKKLEQLLEEGGPRAIDYVFRKHIIPPRFVASVDFSYLSNKALMYVIGILERGSRNGFPIRFEEFPVEDLESCFCVDRKAIDTHLLESLGLVRTLEDLGIEEVVQMIEKDQQLQRKELYKKRYSIYSPLLRTIYIHVANSILNMYSISRLDINSVDDEVYSLLRGCLFESEILFWNLLLNSLLTIRNIRVNAFLEKMVGKNEKWKEFLQDADLEQRSLFAFVFPNLFATAPKMEIFLDPFILKETSIGVIDVSAKTQKLTNGFDIRITYEAGGTQFTALISIPSDYPYKKPIFTSEMGKKSLLNLKINEMIKRCSKFMELVGLWKINIDEKLSGHGECPICYLVIDIHDSSFPNAQCETCKNKFHSRCIVKWVAAGTRNNCPMCRRPIEVIPGKGT
ncbi:RING Zn-finger domain-containing protein [Encephalitozoon intestinalis ATCC 50506]|uniref:E3 ubiquitin-protein ligase listerin n=1 Tax=Encephalitozoon intestinalis (strain ATCC 50506) TaxID=876142 RepID=E0S6X5_ENCIT|nr:RING Zn-finger domain-containing protein [Encephalitozoon intestinalis ATCC 50506]ADM11561.1 RING Zn-finger domain-containing protein [Encephalitozoon intestinalis ATCC 50506]UTX45276.1 hypothetical protein GPK93_05g08220 [Encephalitozoon intestinalis]